eukprot:s278_g20.t1
MARPVYLRTFIDIADPGAESARVRASSAPPPFRPDDRAEAVADSLVRRYVMAMDERAQNLNQPANALEVEDDNSTTASSVSDLEVMSILSLESADDSTENFSSTELESAD